MKLQLHPLPAAWLAEPIAMLYDGRFPVLLPPTTERPLALVAFRSPAMATGFLEWHQQYRGAVQDPQLVTTPTLLQLQRDLATWDSLLRPHAYIAPILLIDPQVQGTTLEAVMASIASENDNAERA